MIQLDDKEFKKILKKIKSLKAEKKELLRVIRNQNEIIDRYNSKFAKQNRDS